MRGPVRSRKGKDNDSRSEANNRVHSTGWTYRIFGSPNFGSSASDSTINAPTSGAISRSYVEEVHPDDCSSVRLDFTIWKSCCLDGSSCGRSELERVIGIVGEEIVGRNGKPVMVGDV